jgi:hypothetical protein
MRMAFGDEIELLPVNLVERRYHLLHVEMRLVTSDVALVSELLIGICIYSRGINMVLQQSQGQTIGNLN